MTVNNFGKGKGIYLSTFETGPINNRLLMNILLWACGLDLKQDYLPDNPNVECAFFPESKTLVVINNSEKPQSTSIPAEGEMQKFKELAPYSTSFYQI